MSLPTPPTTRSIWLFILAFIVSLCILIPSFLGTPQAGKALESISSSLRNSGLLPTSQTNNCNPFESFGFVDPSNDIWTALDSECRAPNQSDILSLLPHLRNKRVYFYGDSVMRYAMTDFCKLTLGKQFETLADPPGYYSSVDLDAIHYCHVPELNFTAVNVYIYGIMKYDNADIPFLSSHHSVNWTSDPRPETWSMEKRLANPQISLNKRFGSADLIVMSSGIWDLTWLQRSMATEIERYNQTMELPQQFVKDYEERVHKYIDTARELHPHSPRILYTTLHDPMATEFDVFFGMEGHSPEYVEFSVFEESRVQGLRATTMMSVARERQKGKQDVKIIPVDQYLRATPVEKRGRDAIHPSESVDQILSLAILWNMKDLFA
jgi:hypothetical protein